MSRLVEPAGPGLTAFIEERFLVPTCSSAQAPPWKWGLRPSRDPLANLLAMRVGSASAIRRAFAAQPVLMEADAELRVYDGKPA